MHNYPEWLGVPGADDMFWIRTDLYDDPEQARTKFAEDWELDIDEVNPYIRIDKIRYSDEKYVLNKGDGVEYYFFSW